MTRPLMKLLVMFCRPEADADTDRASENGQGLEMDAGVLQDDENADDEDDVGGDLRDRVLERAIEAAVDEEAVKEEAFRARGNPEDEKEQADEQENLEEADRHAGERRAPGEGNAEAIDRADGEENERNDAQDRRDDRDEIRVELEAAEEAA